MAMPKLEKQFEYKGFPCVILFMPTGYRCGYVGIPKEVKIDIDNIGCHAHCFDGYDVETAKRLFSDNEKAIKEIIVLENRGYFAVCNEDNPIRTLDYCEEECKKIVNQVVERMECK